MKTRAASHMRSCAALVVILIIAIIGVTLPACGGRTGLTQPNDAAASPADARVPDSIGRRDRGLPTPDGCMPACGARRCGPDPLCSLSCGSCPPGSACTAAGTCRSSTWQTLPHPPINSLHDVWASSPSDVWMVGDTNTATPNVLRGIVLRYDGKTVAEVPTPPGKTLYGVWGLGPSDLWVVGEAGRALRRSGNGWFATPPPTTKILFDVWMVGPNGVWVVGQAGVFRFAGGGGWMPQGDASWKLTTISGKSDKDIWAVGPATGIVRYDGKAWTLQPDPAPGMGSYEGVWRGAGNDVWVVATPQTVLRRRGGKWTQTPLPFKPSLDSMQAVHGTSNSDIWVLGFHGTVHFDGVQWSRSNSTHGGFGLFAVAPDDVWVVGVKTLLRYH